MNNKRRAIANIKNPIGRKAMVILICIPIFLLSVVIFFYALWRGIVDAFKAFWHEFAYHMEHLFTLIAGGLTLGWLGKEEYNKRHNANE
jgi:SNF family Na+-dependent transporter